MPDTAPSSAPRADAQDLAEFAAAADSWFAEHTPEDPGFMLPLTFMEVGTDRQFGFLRDWQRKVWEAGYLGAAWPEAYGGGGLPQAFQSAATRAMRAHKAPIMLNAIGLSWAGPLILDRGTEEERGRYVEPILSAEEIWCQGFSEPDHGSDLGNAQLKAVRDGDEYVLSGSKIWTTLGNYAAHMILLARTNPEAENKYKGLSFFLVPMDAPGIETRKIRKLTGEYGFVQTFFDGARVPASTRMGEEGEGWSIAMQTLEYERGARIGQAGGYITTEIDAMGVVDMAAGLAPEGSAALDDPLVRDRLVRAVMDIQGLNLNGQRRKLPPLTQDRPAALPLMSKLTGSEFVRELGELALEIQGAQAAYYVGEPNAVEDGFWARAYLNAFSATIGGGTSQIQRNIIGEHVLGLPKTR